MVKFSKEICETIYELVSKGFTYKDICAVCDIHENTFYGWIKRGKKAKSGKYRDFYLKVEKCKAVRKNNLKEELLGMGRRKDDWKSIAWMLERGYGDEFARPEVKIRQEIESKVEAEVKVPFQDLERIVIESGKKNDKEKRKEIEEGR